MSVSHKNRGKRLQDDVLAMFAQYQRRGIHCQQNHPRMIRTADGVKYVDKHGFDFQIFYKGRFIAFDCKECASQMWQLDKRYLHQVAELAAINKHGGEGFFLVRFTRTGALRKFTLPWVGVRYSENDGERRDLDIIGDISVWL